MQTASRIIVLNTTKVGDRNLVVHSLSPRFGRRSFITGAGTRSGSMACWQPLSILSAEIRENPKSDLWRIGGVSAIYPLTGLRRDKKKSAISLFMAEVLYRSLRDIPDPELYLWCEKSILTLDSLEDSFSNYHLRWLLELCSSLGFYPSLSDIAPFAGEHLQQVKALMGRYEDALLLPLQGSTRGEIASALLDYLASQLECRLDIRSLAVLSELFR